MLTQPSTPLIPAIDQLGAYFDKPPVERPQMIRGPHRPQQSRWPAEVWAEMQAIYEGKEL